MHRAVAGFPPFVVPKSAAACQLSNPEDVTEIFQPPPALTTFLTAMDFKHPAQTPRHLTAVKIQRMTAQWMQASETPAEFTVSCERGVKAANPLFRRDHRESWRAEG